MVKVEKSIHIASPAEKVYEYLTKAESNVDWMPGMVEVKNISDKTGVGSSFQWIYKMGGIRFEGESVVTEDVPNKKIVTESKGGIKSVWTFTMKPEAQDSNLEMVVEYTIPIPVLGKLAEGLILKQNEREATLALENIKSILEG